MPAPIAVVAAACEFPDARTPRELWNLALHGRQCFRRFPRERLALTDYARGDDDPDGVYAIEAALIEGYAFDRSRFVVPMSSFAATDMAHWMALDVADRALASLPDGWSGDDALRDRMAVIVANTLTGEFSRANLLRYRWPYVEGRAREAVASRMPVEHIDAFVSEFERLFKAPFPPPDEDSLAGGLSNTIAGRIANHFGLRGGAHAVDGACASSLVAVITACEKLRAGDVDCVVVSAVDLSLDPFELVGFARNGALARGAMRVFDRASNGFWPGEGCGCVILASETLVRRRDWPVQAWIRGTGMSTDGKGGLTRPTVGGQLLALQRAWTAAGIDPAAADYFEAHGTGTPTGDPVELAALSQLVRQTGRRPVPVGSIKANIGHTKAAAGMAGLLKALAICAERIAPVTTGCDDPHALFEQQDVKAALRIVRTTEAIDHSGAVVVGVNAFGFGGVNCHVVIEGAQTVRRARQGAMPPVCIEGRLRGEVFCVQAASRAQLLARVERIQTRAATLSRSELIDLAAACRPAPGDGPGWRAAVVATSPQELEACCRDLRDSLLLEQDPARVIKARWSWSGPAVSPAVVAFLFPGQGMAHTPAVDAWSARFAFMADAIARIAAIGGGMDTASVQPRLAEICIASLALLDRLGIQPDLVLGHSFGELSALHAAGALDAATFRQLAGLRGRCMQDHAEPSAMLAIEAGRDLAYALAARHDVDVACHNSLRRHVLAGRTGAMAALAQECALQGIAATLLPADRAFHSRCMRGAQQRFCADMAAIGFCAPTVPVLSTITGGLLADEPLRELLVAQFLAPVKFAEAIGAMDRVDLVIEVGAGPGLGSLVAELDGPACLPLAPFADSLEPLLAAVGAAWACGSDVNPDALYAGRFLKPYRLEVEPRFLANPCGSKNPASRAPPPVIQVQASQAPASHVTPVGRSAFEVLQTVICDLAGLPRASVRAESRLLADLHLNSIRARHAVASTARLLGIAHLPFNPGEIANASLVDVARHLEKLRSIEPDGKSLASEAPQGIEAWVRTLSHRWEDTGEPRAAISGAWPCRLRVDDVLAPLAPELRLAVADLCAADASLPLLLILPAIATTDVLARLLAVARDLAASDTAAGLLVLQGAQLANGFLQSAAAELPDRRICVVQYDALNLNALWHGTREYCRRSRGYSELRLKDGGVQARRVAPHRLERQVDQWLPGPSDLVLVTGGGKGIGAAAARFVAATVGCRLALVGRSPADDPEVAATLAGLAGANLPAVYAQVDLGDARATALAIRNIEDTWGTVTAVIHAAGINRPTAIRDLDLAELQATLAAKLTSIDNLLAALRPGGLRLLVGFASIIGEFGLRGEAHYALANEWLVERMRRYSSLCPSTRCLPVCWSAWRETGMAARLVGVLDELAQADTRALDTVEALQALRALLESGHRDEPLIVTGRHGRVADALTELPALHRHRFLEWPRVFYPGIELIADAQLSTDTDPYLLDHAPYGLPVFPLVAAIEAMLSAAHCLRSDAGLPVIENLRIGEAISCTAGERLIVRTSTLVQPDGSIQASIRCSATDFAIDHFACRIGGNRRALIRLALQFPEPVIPAQRVLYRGLVFHGPAFRKLAGYHRVDARGCVARTLAGSAGRWYGPLQPAALAGGDAGLRDSVLHALQACIPQHPVLPVGVARIEPGRLRVDAEYLICARQTASDGREYTFDIDVCTLALEVVERWEGLRVARVPSDRGDAGLRRVLDVDLLEAFVGRLLQDTLGESEWHVGVCGAGHASPSSQTAVLRALGPHAVLTHRADGAPEVAGHRVSIAHTDHVTLAVAHRRQGIACDVETLPTGDAVDWPLMLGTRRWCFARDLGASAGISLNLACLVCWTAAECLAKLGRDDWPFEAGATKTTDAPHTGPIVALRCRDLGVAVGLVRVAGQSVETAFAVAVETVAAEPSRGRGLRDPADVPDEPLLADGGALP